MQDLKHDNTLNSLYSGPDEKFVQLEDIFSNQQQSYKVKEFCVSLNEKVEYLEQKISGLESALGQSGMPVLAHNDLFPKYVNGLTQDLRKKLEGFKIDQNSQDSFKNAQQALLKTRLLFAIISNIELTELLITLFKDSVGTNNDRFKRLISVIEAFSLGMEFKDTSLSPSTPLFSPGFRERTVSNFSSPLLPRSLTFSGSFPSPSPSSPDKSSLLCANVGADIYLARVRAERQLTKIQLYKAAGLSIPEDLQLLAQQYRFTRELLERGNRQDLQQEIKLLSELPDLVNQLRKDKQESARNPESDQKGLIQKERVRAAEFKLLQKHSAWLELRCEQGEISLDNILSRSRTFSEIISPATPKSHSVETLSTGTAIDELHTERQAVYTQLRKLKHEILGSELMRSRIKRTNHLRLEIHSLTDLNNYSSAHKNLFGSLILQKTKDKELIDNAISEALPGYQGSDDKERTPHESRIAYIKKLFLNSVGNIEELETETNRLRQIVARLSIRLLSGVLLQTLNINLQRVAGVDSGLLTADVSGSITYWTRAIAIIPHFRSKLQILLTSLPKFITDDQVWLKPSARLAELWAQEAESAALIQSMADRESYYEKALGTLSIQLQQEKAALTAILKQITHACEHQTSAMEIKFSIDPENDYTRLYQHVKEFDEKPAKLEDQSREKLRSLGRLSLQKSEALVFLIANGVQSVTLPAEIKTPFDDWRKFCEEKLLDSELSGMNFASTEICTSNHIDQLSTLKMVLSGPVFRNLRAAFLKDITEITAEASFFTLEDYFMTLINDFQEKFTQLLITLGPTRPQKPSDEECRANIMNFLRYLKGEKSDHSYSFSPLIPPKGELMNIWVNNHIQNIFDKRFKVSKMGERIKQAPIAELISDCLKLLLWGLLLRFADKIAGDFDEKLTPKKLFESTEEFHQRLTEFHLRIANFRNNALRGFLLKEPTYPAEAHLFNGVKLLRTLASKPELLATEDLDSFMQQYDFTDCQSAFLDRVRRSYAGRLYVVLGEVRENWNTSRAVVVEFQALRNKIEQIPEDSYQWALITAKLVKDEIQLQQADAIAREKKAEEAARIESSQRLESHRAEQKKLSDALIVHSPRHEENSGDMKNGQFARVSALCRISTRQQAAQMLLQMAREWSDIQSTAIVEIKIQGYVLKLIRDEKELEGLATAGKKIYIQWNPKEGVYHYHYYVNWNGIPEKKDLEVKAAHSEIELAVKNPSRNNFNFSSSCIDDATDVIFRAEKAALEQKMQRSGGLDLSKVPLQVEESFRISMKRLQKANGYLPRIEAVNKKLALPESPQQDADLFPELPESLFATTMVTEKEASEQLAEAQASLKAVFDPLLNIAGPLRECFHQYRKLSVQEKLLLSLKEEFKQGKPLTTERFILEKHHARLDDVAREIARLFVDKKMTVQDLEKFNVESYRIKESSVADFLINYCQSEPYAWYAFITRACAGLNDELLMALTRLAGGILYGEVTGNEEAFPITEYKYHPVIAKIFPESKEEKYTPVPCPLLAGLENTQWAKRLSALENLHRIISAIPEPRFSEVLNHLEILHKDLVSGAWRRKRVESPQEKAKKAEALNIDLLTNTQHLIENAVGPEGLELIDRLGVQDWDIYKSMSPHLSTLWSWKFDEECSAAFQALYQHFVSLLDEYLDISSDYIQSEPLIELLSILENLRTSQNVNVKVAWSDEVNVEKLNSRTECAVRDSKFTPCLDKFPDLLKLKTDPVKFNKVLREKLINVGILPGNISFWDKLTKKAIIHNGQVTKVTDLKQITQKLDELSQAQDEQKNYQNLFAQINPQLRKYVTYLKETIYCCDGASSDERLVILRRQKDAIAKLVKQCFSEFNFTSSSSADDEEDQVVVKDFQQLESWLISERNKFNQSLATPGLVTSLLPTLLIEEKEETPSVLLTPKSTSTRSSLPSTPDSRFNKYDVQSQVERERKHKHKKNKDLRGEINRLRKENEELKTLSRVGGSVSPDTPDNIGNGSPFLDCDTGSDTSFERKSVNSLRSISGLSSVALRKNSRDQKKSAQDPSTTLSMQLRLFSSAINEAKKQLNELLVTRELLQSLAKTASENASLVNVLPGLSLVSDNRSALDLCTQLSATLQQKLKHSADLEKKSEDLSKTVLELKTACGSEKPGPEFLAPWIESKIKNCHERIKDNDKLISELNSRYTALVNEEKQKSILSQSSPKNPDDLKLQTQQILYDLATRCKAKENYHQTLKNQERGLLKKSPAAVKMTQEIKRTTEEIIGLKKQIEVQESFLHASTPSKTSSAVSEERSQKIEEELKELRQSIIKCAQARADQAYDVQQLSQNLLTITPSFSAIVVPPLPALPEDIKYEWKPSASAQDRQSQLSEQNTKESCVELQKRLVENTQELESVTDQSYGLKEWILKDVEGEALALLGKKEEMEYLPTDNPEYQQWEAQVRLLIARLQTPLPPASSSQEYQKWQEQIQVLVTRLHPGCKDVNFQEEKLLALEVKGSANVSTRNNYAKLVKEKEPLETAAARLQSEQKQLAEFLSKTPAMRRQENLNAMNPVVLHDAQIRLKSRCFFWNLKASIVEEQRNGYVFEEKVYSKISSAYEHFRPIGDKVDPNRKDLSVEESEYYIMTIKYSNLVLRYDELKRYALENVEALKKLEQNELPQRRGNWYNLNYMAISTEVKDENLVAEIKEKHFANFKTPILLKHGDNIKLWGYANGEWKITFLNPNIFSRCGLNFTGTCQSWSWETIHPDVLREIQLQKAHTRPADTEKTILDEHKKLQERTTEHGKSPLSATSAKYNIFDESSRVSNPNDANGNVEVETINSLLDGGFF